MISKSDTIIRGKCSPQCEDSRSIEQQHAYSNILNKDYITQTPIKELDNKDASLSLSLILPNLEDIQAQFWKELNEIPKRILADTKSKINGLIGEREEVPKAREKRKYVRKAKLMEEMSDEEFDGRRKTFIVENNSTISQLIDDTIIYSRKQTKKQQIKDEIKNKNNNASNDDTESVSGSSYNLKLDSDNSSSQTTTKITTFGSGFHKKSANLKNCMWNNQEVEKFYSLLEFLGTDFSLISSFLKTKTISQIKKKYHQEMKKNPVKVNEALNKESFKVCADNHHYLLGISKTDDINQMPQNLEILNSQRIQFRQEGLQTKQMMKGAIIMIMLINQVYRNRYWRLSFILYCYSIANTVTNNVTVSISSCSLLLPLEQLQISSQTHSFIHLLLQTLNMVNQSQSQSNTIYEQQLQVNWQSAQQIFQSVQSNQITNMPFPSLSLSLKSLEQSLSPFLIDSIQAGISRVIISHFVKKQFELFYLERERHKQQHQHPLSNFVDLSKQVLSLRSISWSCQDFIRILLFIYINENIRIEADRILGKFKQSSLKLINIGRYPEIAGELIKEENHKNYLQPEGIKKIDDSFVEETNIFNQKLQESMLIITQDKQKPSTSMTLIQSPHNYPSFSAQQGTILENILTDDEIENEELTKSSNIPKKIQKDNINFNQSYIMKIQKEKEERQKNRTKGITHSNLTHIKSKVYGYINSSKSPKNKKTFSTNKSANIQELKTSFLDNLRKSNNGKPIPKPIDKNKNKMNTSLNLSSSPILRTSIISGSDSKYNSIDKSQKLQKVLDPASQKQFEILQKHNDNFKIKSGLQFHKYCLVGQEDKDEKRVKDNKNLSKSQILQKYAEKEKNEFSKPNIFDWELNDDDISELDYNEELTPKHFNKFTEQYKKWWFDLDDSQKMHFFSSEELVKYYKSVKYATQDSLFKFLKSRKIKRAN